MLGLSGRCEGGRGVLRAYESAPGLQCEIVASSNHVIMSEAGNDRRIRGVCRRRRSGRSSCRSCPGRSVRRGRAQVAGGRVDGHVTPTTNTKAPGTPSGKPAATVSAAPDSNDWTTIATAEPNRRGDAMSWVTARGISAVESDTLPWGVNRRWGCTTERSLD